MADLSSIVAGGAQSNPYAAAANFATGMASGGPSSASSDSGAVSFSNPFSGGNATFGPVNIGSSMSSPTSNLTLTILVLGGIGALLLMRRR